MGYGQFAGLLRERFCTQKFEGITKTDGLTFKVKENPGTGANQRRAGSGNVVPMEFPSDLTPERPARDGNIIAVLFRDRTQTLTKKEISADHPTCAQVAGDFSVFGPLFQN